MGSLRCAIVLALSGCAVGGSFSPDSAIAKADSRTSPIDTHPQDSHAVDAAAGATALLWLKFDEPAGTGTVTNSGTLANANPTVIFTQQGMLGHNGGSAIKFATTNDGVLVPSQAGLDGFTHVTVEAWIKYAAWNTTDYSTIAKRNQSFLCRIY